MPSHDPGSTRARLSSNWLWFLAAALGIASIHLTMTIVHDTSRGRAAVRAVAQALADQTAAGLSNRATLVAARGVRSVPGDLTVLRDSVFEPFVREATSTFSQLVELDTASISLTNSDSSVAVGSLSARHAFRASAPARDLLDGWTVLVALHQSQVPHSIVAPVPDDRLWLLGLIGLLTIAVLLVAVGSSRRELLIARARSDFIAGVSHELRMPLAQILLAGETLTMQRERGQAERTTLSRSIVREARRLIGLVDNVLFFSRSDATKLAVHRQPVDVTSMFAGVVESVELAVTDAGQTIQVESPGGIRVLADADLMRHALVNLVDNALKYGKGGQTVHVRAEQVARRVRLHVDDEGPGIPRAERTRVFDAYERLARDQVSEKTGTGLGLAIVRRIVEACNGRVWIEDAPSGGARATIELDAP